MYYLTHMHSATEHIYISIRISIIQSMVTFSVLPISTNEEVMKIEVFKTFVLLLLLLL